MQKALLVFSCVWRALVGLDVPHTTALDKYVVCTYRLGARVQLNVEKRGVGTTQNKCFGALKRKITFGKGWRH